MAAKTIVLKGDPLVKEATAAGTITPGMLIEMASATTVQAHSSSGGDAAALFAVEDSLQGNEIGDDYSASDNVQYVHARPGDEIYAFLADGENASAWDELESDGAGALKVHTAPASNSDGAFDEGGESIYTKAVVARALEAKNCASSAVTAAQRIKVVVV